MAYGLLGAVTLPLLALFVSLALFHALVPQCGTPGDSGGCEMSSAMIGVGAVIPGFLLGAAFGLRHTLNRRRAAKQAAGSGNPEPANVPTRPGGSGRTGLR
jgi:hypothetical protein